VRIILPFAPGGSLDALGRIVFDRMSQQSGHQFVIDYRPGASGNIGTELVARSAPDGYTNLLNTLPLVVNPSLFRKLPFDVQKDFAPVSLIASAPFVMVVHPSVPAKTVKEFIALAKSHPGKLNYSSAGNGTTPHLTAEMFQSMAGIKIVHIPHKGYPASILAVLGGQVDLMFVELGSVLPQIRSDKLRVLAVASEKRNPLVPAVPALSEVLPGFVAVTWYGMVAPPGTPSAVASKLSAAISEALKQPDVVRQLQDLSVDPVGSTPAEMVQFMAQESRRWGNVIRATGATVD
jgi:tripartite-type tricarboxylate transporter receptor subunit TctC